MAVYYRDCSPNFNVIFGCWDASICLYYFYYNTCYLVLFWRKCYRVFHHVGCFENFFKICNDRCITIKFSINIFIGYLMKYNNSSNKGVQCMRQIIKNVMLINGMKGNIVIKGHKIIEITARNPVGEKIISLPDGVYVSPGWIDIHTHSFPK